MSQARPTQAFPTSGWRKTGALFLGIAAVGLPINHVGIYAILVVFAVLVFSGEVEARPRRWLFAVAIVAAAAIGQIVLAPPRIDEGHNVFLPGPPDGVLQRGLPADVYRHMAREFEALYPPAVRCKPGSVGCWQESKPDRVFAFSADSIFAPSTLSRAATALDFSDPVWLRLGFINQMQFNWSTDAPDMRRADRDRRVWMGFQRWHWAAPWFEAVRLPAAYAGGEMCWRGEIMWEGADGRYALMRGPGCRTVESADAGRLVFGIGIKPATLAMQLKPPWRVWLLQLASAGVAVAAVIALVVVVVRVAPRRTIVPFLLLGLSVAVIALNDASFLGGIRPFDGGDDGIFYDHVGRVILQKLLTGDVSGFLEGGEKVFFYGGPGLRYFRALEHLVFGESYFGYLSLVLLFPFAVLGLFNRFLPRDWSLVLVMIFVAVPVGVVFGTSFVQYAKWAARGFADSAAYIFFICAIVPVIGRAASGPTDRFSAAFFGAFLLALAIFMKPIVVPAAAVLLAGAGFAALAEGKWRRLAGLCLGFVPVLSMALHNWVYGNVFVPFSANSTNELVYVMPPSAWLAAFQELVTLHWSGAHLSRALQQIPGWLSGPAESYWTAPLNAAGVAVLGYVVLRGRRFDPWLRLIGAAALAQHAVAWFYVGTVARYHFLTWFLTAVVVLVWFHAVALEWLRLRYPALCKRLAAQPWRMRLASGVSRLQKVSS